MHYQVLKFIFLYKTCTKIIFLPISLAITKGNNVILFSQISYYHFS